MGKSYRRSGLTKKQFQLFSFVQSFLEEEGYCPSIEEIGKSLGLSSTATVHKHLSNLEAKGYLRRERNRSRSIEILQALPSPPTRDLPGRRELTPDGRQMLSLPLKGRIAAGKPLEAVSGDETLSLSEFSENERVYVLQVKGNSMVDDHICNGDYVVVERVSTANPGDTVVALLGNHEATLKKYFREKGSLVRLQPANTSMQPLFVPEQEVKIQGRVIAVLRKYQ
ncbi:MAG: transcriptional repressor LexA [Terriglobia bacterium]